MMSGNDDAHGGEAAKGTAAIYHKLRKGLGHELVTQGNVQELILMATQYGDMLTETLLREWQSSCGDAAAIPALKASGH